MSKRKGRGPKKAAKRLPKYMQDIAFSKNTRPRLSRHWKGQAKWGAASEVRHIDPATVDIS